MNRKFFLLMIFLIILFLPGCNLPFLQNPGGIQAGPKSPTATKAVTSNVSTAKPTQSLTVPTSQQYPTRNNTIIGTWGHLANPGYENDIIKTTLFFPGQAKDASRPYGCDPGDNTGLYTVHPEDERQLRWAENLTNRRLVIGQMNEVGINVISMSTWGEAFLPCVVGWPHIAPMQVAPLAMDELFTVASDRKMLIMPFIESRNDWSFPDDFPFDASGEIAPGTISQVVDLIERYLINQDHPEWARQWAQVYDHNHIPRYAVVIIHAASNQIKSTDHYTFAAGFDAISYRIEQQTGVKVGFFIDPLPPNSNAPGTFKPSPEATGPELANVDALLGIQAFIPEIWIKGSPTLASIISWKTDFSRRWSNTGIPFLMDVSPGYDAHIVFPSSRVYGFNQTWQDALTKMTEEYGQDGLVYNSWNGYTEAMAAVPTAEYGDHFYLWLKYLTAMIGNR